MRGGGLVQYILQTNRHGKMALDMLYLCDMVIGSGWDMPTHEDMCKETTCNNPKYLVFQLYNAGLVGISLHEKPNSSGSSIVLWDSQQGPYLS